jgi:hypothetical protein
MLQLPSFEPIEYERRTCDRAITSDSSRENPEQFLISSILEKEMEISRLYQKDKAKEEFYCSLLQERGLEIERLLKIVEETRRNFNAISVYSELLAGEFQEKLNIKDLTITQLQATLSPQEGGGKAQQDAENRSVTDPMTCFGCCFARKDMIFVPCNHIVFCESCTDKHMTPSHSSSDSEENEDDDDYFMEEPILCPICRDPVMEAQKVYL